MSLLHILILSTLAVAVASQLHFQEWYPENGGYFIAALKNNCAREYNDYITGKNPSHDRAKAALTNPVVTCILSNVPEQVKANMASAGVVLGLIPSLLSVISSSIPEVGLVAMQRPLLAFLAAAGTPAINPLTFGDYTDPTSVLQQHSTPDMLPQLHLGATARFIVSFLEYILLSGSVANNIHLAYQLGVQCNVAWSTETFWIPALWGIIGLAVHVAGSAPSVRLRVYLEKSSADPASASRKRGAIGRAWSLLRQEFTLSEAQPNSQLKVRDAQLWSIFSIALHYTAQLVVMWQILASTFAFSALLFISAVDSFPIVARYFLATLVCRVIIRYELRGMWKVIETPNSNLSSQKLQLGETYNDSSYALISYPAASEPRTRVDKRMRTFS